jgi:hypothetical protein
MTDFSERLTHYETKCRQHLSRVRLSHVLALGALSGEKVQSDDIAELIRVSFDDEMQDRYKAKVHTVLHKLHLLSLKANFELFLNRLLSTVWTFHFPELRPTIPGDMSLPLRKLAAEFGPKTESSVDVREFIINRIVPAHGLQQFEKALAKATRIQLSDVLNRKNVHNWPQIYTAFEVRHLVEHRDGRADNEFRTKLAQVWVQSSWGRRQRLERLKKVPVEKEDVVETYTAMLDATELLTAEVLRWSLSRQAK